MADILVASIGLAGAVVTLVGSIVQRRALARYGKAEARSRLFRASWNCGDMFPTADGMRMFLKADAAVTWGLMAMLGAIGYLIGRG